MQQFLLDLAGVELCLNVPPGIQISYTDPNYNEFFKANNRPKTNPCQIRIDLTFGLIPETGHMARIFDTELSWKLLQKDSDYYFRMDHGGTSDPYLIARFGPDASAVAVYCSDEYVNGLGEVLNPVQYPLDQVLLMYYLSTRKGAIVHSAGILVDDKGYLFPGCSGAGKTTISKRLGLRKGVQGLSDDRIIVRKIEQSFAIFGTPWPGDARIAVNESAPLSRIYFLVQSKENRVERITGAEAFRRLIPVLSIQWFDKDAITRIFSFIEELVSNIPSYLLHFTPDIEVEALFG